MKRKDLFREGFKSVFNFTFAQADNLTETIKEVWAEEQNTKPRTETKTRKAKKEKPVKIPKTKLPKSKMFQTLSPPPGYSPEFFTLCTGCNECMFACPYAVIFPVTLPDTNKQFPFIDPNAKACHMCEDWPCINVCPEKALIPFNEHEEKPKIGLAKAIHEHCINSKTGEETCNVCFVTCPIEKTV
ncbi:4Fe-4S dicluster domain-containing protein, partial [Leptospira sp. 96542]|nr:4Fe-4S dicluster domain-containing protein [Leptospira sp. 96542]